ncbi:MAG: DISARM system SNF2-like helicase DrmD, partial [Phycicoccus sp.]
MTPHFSGRTLPPGTDMPAGNGRVDGGRARRTPIPEPGQVVRVRGSIWAVANVDQQRLPRSPADEAVAGLTHVVSLQSLEEDRLGDELDVVWELEVGHSITPPQGLPESITDQSFDDPNALAGFVDALRWGAVTTADHQHLQAPFRSGVDIKAYQLEPLRLALENPRTNLLLADDVGLGKTIEAGLVIQELLLRHRARTVVVVCPPSLALKWQDEMREKFGLEFTIVNSDRLADVRRTHGLHANPFLLFPRIIVSMAWLPQPRAQRMLREVLGQSADRRSGRQYAFDLVVVDEAHHVAPASPSAIGGGRGYAMDTQRTIAVRALAERCEHRLFLSATPHNGHPESFTALMEMIDPRRFARGAKLDEAALAQVMVRRLKSQLPGEAFTERRVREVHFTPAQAEREMFERLGRVLGESSPSGDRGVTRQRPAHDMTALLLKKRFLSSPYAFGATLDHYLESRGAGGDRYDGWDDSAYDDLWGEGANDEEEGHWEQPEAAALVRAKAGDMLSSVSAGELSRLRDWGLGHASRPDSRAAALLSYL